MNTEFLSALKQIEKERSIPVDKLLPFIEDALVAAYKKNFGDQNVTIEIDRVEARLIEDESPFTGLGQPVFCEVLAIDAASCRFTGFRVAHAGGHEGAAATAENKLEPITGGPVDELTGDILAAAVTNFGIIFPVAAGRFRIGGRWGGMCDPRRRDDAGRKTGGFGDLEEAVGALPVLRGAIAI